MGMAHHSRLEVPANVDGQTTPPLDDHPATRNRYRRSAMNLGELQKAVHVAKDKKNDFGGYNYRTAEGILAAIKAVLPEGASITVTDDLREVAGQIFVQAEATVDFGDGQSHTTKGFALHPLTKKGMDPSQITGSASSYARKYALSGLAALDDGSADPDAAKEPYQPGPTTQDKVNAAKTLNDINALLPEVTAMNVPAAKQHLHSKATELGLTFDKEARAYITL
jgi:hypothetical protein